jgi:hypothetical protein
MEKAASDRGVMAMAHQQHHHAQHSGFGGVGFCDGRFGGGAQVEISDFKIEATSEKVLGVEYGDPDDGNMRRRRVVPMCCCGSFQCGIGPHAYVEVPDV